MSGIEDKVVVITGESSGIGEGQRFCSPDEVRKA